MSLFQKWSARKEAEPAPVPAGAEPASEPPITTKVLPRFLSAISQNEAPVLVDLGPVVGQNVAFFGERLSCKIHVEDLFAIVETYAKQGNREGLLNAMSARLKQPTASVDGILCWDLFDYLDRTTAPALAAILVALLRPGGVCYGFFTTKAGPVSHYTRYLVEGGAELRQRTYSATATTRTAFVTRDITKMFAGLHVTESVLLKNNIQEVLLKRARPEGTQG